MSSTCFPGPKSVEKIHQKTIPLWYDPSAGHQSLHLSKVHLNIGLRAIKESRRMAELVTGCVCSTGIAFPGCSGHDCSTGPWFLKKRWPFLSFHIQSVPQVICKNRHPSWLAKLVVAWQPCHMQIEGEHVAKEYLGEVWSKHTPVLVSWWHRKSTPSCNQRNHIHRSKWPLQDAYHDEPGLGGVIIAKAPKSVSKSWGGTLNTYHWYFSNWQLVKCFHDFAHIPWKDTPDFPMKGPFGIFLSGMWVRS